MLGGVVQHIAAEISHWCLLKILYDGLNAFYAPRCSSHGDCGQGFAFTSSERHRTRRDIEILSHFTPYLSCRHTVSTAPASEMLRVGNAVCSHLSVFKRSNSKHIRTGFP